MMNENALVWWTDNSFASRTPVHGTCAIPFHSVCFHRCVLLWCEFPTTSCLRYHWCPTMRPIPLFLVGLFPVGLFLLQLEDDCATKVQTYPNQPTSAGIRIIPMPSPDLSSAVLAYQGFEATRKEIRIPHSCHWEGSVPCQNGDLGAISGVEYTSRAQAGWRKFPGETCNEKGRL